MDTPASSDHEYWEPKALVLIELLKSKGPMSLRAVKTAMRFKKFKIHITVNVLSYLDLTKRAHYDTEAKVWKLTKTADEPPRR